ncbi:hypothetical protein HDU92_008948 [Lobulomyces angularis]|nr:hypothetical protein HDU92_008948 [Lobulomyces angularis]
MSFNLNDILQEIKFQAHQFSIPISSQVKLHLTNTYTVLSQLFAISAVCCYLSLKYAFFNAFTEIAFLTTFISMIAFFFITPTTQNYNTRKYLLYTFAASKGFAISPLLGFVGFHNPGSIVVSLGAVAVLFVCFTYSAMKSPNNMYSAGLLSSTMGILFWVQMMQWFVYSSKLQVIELYLGIALFSIYLIYDTQLMIQRANAGKKDELKDALNLYVDIFQLFIRILVLLNDDKSKRDERRRNRRR